MQEIGLLVEKSQEFNVIKWPENTATKLNIHDRIKGNCILFYAYIHWLTHILFNAGLKAKGGFGLFCPYLSVPDHDHADQDNVDVGSQWLVVVDFIHLRTARGHEIINLTNQTQESKPWIQHTNPPTAVTLCKKSIGVPTKTAKQQITTTKRTDLTFWDYLGQNLSWWIAIL